MKTTVKKPLPKALIATIAVVTLGVLTACIVFASTGSVFGWKPFSQNSQDTSGNNSASNEQIKNGETIKDNSTNSGKPSGSDEPAAPVTQSDGRNLVEINITSVNLVESTLKIGVMISSIDQNGNCTLSIMNSSNTAIYTSTVGVQAQSSTSVCKGFSIPASSLPSGTYTIKVAYSSGNTYGNAEQAYVSK
jgi:hypothetical protein